MDLLQRGSSLYLKGLFLNAGVRGMLERRDYYAVDMVFPIFCVFIDRVTGYTRSPKMTRVQVMYSSLMSRVMSRNWRRGWTSE